MITEEHRQEFITRALEALMLGHHQIEALYHAMGELDSPGRVEESKSQPQRPARDTRLVHISLCVDTKNRKVSGRVTNTPTEEGPELQLTFGS